MSPTLQHWSTGGPWLDLHCQLGEGPYYEAGTNTLRFVDIGRKQLHAVSLTAGPASLATQTFADAVTVTADIEGVDDRILVGAKQGLALLHRRRGELEYLVRFADVAGANGAGGPAERVRSNDGAVDPHGRFWLGTMTDFPYGEVRPEGSLLRFSGDRTASVIKTALSIPNSVGWSPDGRTAYFTHSTARQVLAWDYDPASGAVSAERVFYQHPGRGEPDGFRVDVDGNLWHAVYGESCVLKISPQGELVGLVRVPTRNVTCVEFVGTELYITTAADGEGDEESRRFGGGLFRVDVGVRGLEHVKFKLES